MCNTNYMDGVPVKIAEKYKPLPSIYNLPQPLTSKLNQEENFYWNCPLFAYDLELEKKALIKIEQWKRIRQRNKEERKERILRRERQRRREDEDRQKNLLCSVSYPSTDDLSSEEEEVKVEHDTEYKESDGDVSEFKKSSPHINVMETASSFHNILQPTVLSLNSNSNVKCPLTPIMKSIYENKISNSFDYKDFEDDTSSPFDNIELKTINDLDVLAQVLHNTQINSPAYEINENVTRESSVINNKISFFEQNQEEQIHYDSLIASEHIPKANDSLPRFKNDIYSHEGALTHIRDHNISSGSVMQYNANFAPLQPVHLYNGLNNSNSTYDYPSNDYNQTTNEIKTFNHQTYDQQQTLMEDQISKSKSVPDILKELREEIRKSEIKRHRNCSYNKDDSAENIDVCLTNEHRVRTADVEGEDIFNKMDSKGKQLVEQISAMGFPFKRVARIVQLVGTDDKKVVEHLISISELSDLGFEESKISDALIRNENNRNKALDDLIS